MLIFGICIRSVVNIDRKVRNRGISTHLIRVCELEYALKMLLSYKMAHRCIKIDRGAYNKIESSFHIGQQIVSKSTVVDSKNIIFFMVKNALKLEIMILACHEALSNSFQKLISI